MDISNANSRWKLDISWCIYLSPGVRVATIPAVIDAQFKSKSNEILTLTHGALEIWRHIPVASHILLIIQKTCKTTNISLILLAWLSIFTYPLFIITKASRVFYELN